MIFASRLKELREEKKFSQATLAKEIGIAQSTIGGWEAENREPNIDMLVKISDYFGITIDYLVGRSNDPHGYKIKTPAELADVHVEEVVKTENKPLTPEELEIVRQMVQAHLDDLRNKD